MVQCLIKPRTAEGIVRPKRRQYVTIAAGIVASDGLILAADSHESVDDYLKVFRPKLVDIPLMSSELKCVIAGAGDGPFIDMLVERISDALELSNPYTPEAKQQIQGAITHTCDEIWPHYTTQPDKPQASLLIGVRGNDGLALYEAGVPMIKTVDRYSYIGSGRVLALYKSKQLMPEFLPLDSAVSLTAHILDLVKKNAERCGGDTNIITLTSDGIVEHKTQEEIETAEKGYENVAWALDTFVLPLLPLVTTPKGKGVLAMIAALGAPVVKRQEDYRKSLVTLVANMKAGIVLTPQEQAKNAALIVLFVATILRDSLMAPLSGAGIISDTEREKLHKVADMFARMAQASMTAYQIGVPDAGEKGLRVLIDIVIRLVADENIPAIDNVIKSLPAI